MRRKNLMTALMCTACLAVSAPAGVMAEETTEAVTETEAESEDGTEAGTEAGSEDGTEAENESETEKAAPLERPDYRALDYVTLGEYKGLVVVPSSTEATEDEISNQIENDAMTADVFEEHTEGTVEDGDLVCIDFVGTLDGEAFDGGTAKDTDLEIGSHTFIDGFEDGLIGVNVGETIDLPLTFPEDYFNTDLAGKEVVFEVTVNSIKTMPELTDDLVNTMTQGLYTDVDSYKESIRQSIEDSKKESRDSEIRSQLLTMVASGSTIEDYPQEMLDYGRENMTSFYKEQAELYQMEYEDFLSTFFGLTEEQFNEQVDLMTRQNLQQELYLKAIAETEGMEISDEEYTQGCEDYAEYYGYESTEELVAEYGESMIRASLLQDKVMDFIVENAVIEESEQSETEASSEAVSESEDATEASDESSAEDSTESTSEQETDASSEEQTEA